jgi:exodeoxyribonuclease III
MRSPTTVRGSGTGWPCCRGSDWTPWSVASPASPTTTDARRPGPIAATCGGVRVWSLYVPNGREVDSDHYAYKLAWLDALAAATAGEPELALCGDMNIAPADADVFDPGAFSGHTHVTVPERRRLAAFGLTDVVRERWPEQRVFSYWDYRAGMFHQDLGMRIDLVLASATRSRRASGRRGSTARPARANSPAITRPSSSTWTSPPTETSGRWSRRHPARPRAAG